MKKQKSKIEKALSILCFGIASLFVILTNVGVVNAANKDQYQPLAPINGITDTNSIPPIDSTTGLSVYVTQLYKWGVAGASGLAVLMIIWGGVGYVTSAGGGGIEEAKAKISAAITGLLLALGSYIILNTINKDLLSTKFDLEPIKVQVNQGGINSGGTNNGVTPGNNGGGTTVTGDYSYLNSFTTDQNGNVTFTSYGYAGDTTPDSNSMQARGNNGNLLESGSVALSPDIIRAYNAKPGAAVYVNGTQVGYYDDSTAESYNGKPLTNRVDIYDPSGSLGGNSFSKPVNGTITVDNNNIRPQKPNPSK